MASSDSERDKRSWSLIPLGKSRDPSTPEKSKIKFTENKSSGVSSGKSVVHRRQAVPVDSATSSSHSKSSGSRDPDFEVHISEERSIIDSDFSDSDSGSSSAEEEVARTQDESTEISKDQSAEVEDLKKQLAKAKANEEKLQLRLEASTLENFFHKSSSEKNSSRGSRATDKGSTDRPKKSSKTDQKKRDPKDLSSDTADKVKVDLSELIAAINSMNNRMVSMENEIKDIRFKK